MQLQLRVEGVMVAACKQKNAAVLRLAVARQNEDALAEIAVGPAAPTIATAPQCQALDNSGSPDSSQCTSTTRAPSGARGARIKSQTSD